MVASSSERSSAKLTDPEVPPPDNPRTDDNVTRITGPSLVTKVNSVYCTICSVIKKETDPYRQLRQQSCQIQLSR